MLATKSLMRKEQRRNGDNMSRYWNDETVYSQPSVDKLQTGAAATAKKARARGSVLEPVVIKGKGIAKSWWGQAWCDNLETYADYENRLDRGKYYVRAGAVVDLQIQKGRVLAKVQGRRRAPYKVEVRISPLSEERCQKILESCGRRIENLELLLQGNFPEELKELFVGSEGLFPRQQEIGYTCSCPDWALMCKHVAAVLYGIGARFDDNPLLFFELRGIDVNRFVDVAIENRIEKMLKNADRPSPRIIVESSRLEIFGF